jgi:DNA-binding SARP family transcriptional activator
MAVLSALSGYQILEAMLEAALNTRNWKSYYVG